MKRRYLLAMSLAMSGVFAAGQSPLRYPETPQGPVSDNYHGTQVADPYRWMEATDAPEVKAWVAAQNQLARPLLET